MENIKLLPQSKKINTSSFLGKEKKENGGGNLSVISEKVIRIEKLLGGQNKLLQNRTKNIKKQEELSKRKKGEEKLEEKPKDKEEKDGRKLLKGPRLGFLDKIKNFLGKMILGFIAVRLIPYLPQLLQIVPKISAVNEFFIDTGIGLVDGFATFVNGAYELRDKTLGFIEGMGGDFAVDMFKNFEGVIGKVLEAAIIVAMSAGGEGGLLDTGGELIGDFLKKRASQAGAQAATQAGGGAAQAGGIGAGAVAGIVAGAGLLASALGEGAFQLKKLGQGLESGAKKRWEEKKIWDPRKPLDWAIWQGSRFINFQLGLVGGLLDIVGAPFRYAIELLRYPFLSEEDKKKQATNLAKFDARVRENLRQGLNMLTLGLAFKEKGSFGNIFGNQGAQKQMMSKMAGGGITRGGRTQGAISRTVKKKEIKRVVKPTKTQLKPGKNVGGEEKIEKIFPESKKRDQVSPLGYIKETYDTTNEIPFFGPIFDIAYKTLLGNKPNSVDYKNVSFGLNSWMNDTFDPNVMRSGGAFAGGGEVNAEMFMKGSDLTGVIAKSVEESMASKIDDTFTELQKQLSLRYPEPKVDKSDPTLDIEDEGFDGDITPGLWGPLLDLIAGKESGGNYEAMYPSTVLKGATKMTIAEVARRATGAVGKYQQLPQYLVGRAKAAGLNPDKDLYSPENQDLIITKVNIKGRGGERWLKGEISDEQFMQGLSQEFASLPNAQGVFYYPGQRSSMTPSKVKSALSRVKSGGNSLTSRSHRGDLPGEILGGRGSFGLIDPTPKSTPGVRGSSGYAADSGLDIVGKTGDPIVSPVSGTLMYAETGHTSWSDDSDPGTPGKQAQHSFLVKLSKPFKYGGKIVKYAYGTHLSSLSRSVANKSGISIRSGQTIGRMGVANKVPHLHLGLLQNRAQSSEADWLSNTQVKSVLSARLARGGLVRGFTKAILGERGIEFVLDNDTTVALQKTFPGFLDALNHANLNEAVNVLRDYASYEAGAAQEVQITNNIINMMVDSPQPTPIIIGGSGGGMDDFAEALAAGQ